MDVDSEEEKESSKSTKGNKKRWKKSEAENEIGLLPDIRNQIYRFSSIITWKTINKKKIPEPKEGLDPAFDEANRKIDEIKK